MKAKSSSSSSMKKSPIPNNQFLTTQPKNENLQDSNKMTINTPKYINTILQDKEEPIKSPSLKISSKLDSQGKF